MSPRRYESPRRNAAAARTRRRIVAAAAAILGAAEGIGEFSLEAVAKKASVTRLTVYNQFGSRRALLEAVFDERAARGGLHRIADVMAGADRVTGWANDTASAGGRTLDVNSVVVFTMRDGKVTEGRQFVDDQAALDSFLA